MLTWRSASRIFPGFRACHRRSDSMKIIEVQWYDYRLPFRSGFTTAHGVLTAREGIIVQLKAERGISGTGEIAPLPAPGEASLVAARSLLPALAARLHGRELDEALDILPTVGADLSRPPPIYRPASLQPSRPSIGYAWADKSAVGAINRPLPRRTARAETLCGLEIALLDAIGNVEGCAVSALLSPAGSAPRAVVPVNAVIGARTTDAAVAAAQEARRNGFQCVKLKVGLGGSTQEEVERVAAVRDAIGPDMHLRLDANEAWELEEAIDILTLCVPYALQYVEQPLKAHDLAGMRALRRAVPVPIAADEALHGLESARLVLDNEAADILVIKPQLAGGLRAGRQIIQAAAERGVGSVVTSTLEAGIGVAAALHLAAASPAVTLECGLATLDLLIDDLVLNDLPVRAGVMAVPGGAGLGVALDWEALQRYS
jgi:o-succinylbenzoate synthase